MLPEPYKTAGLLFTAILDVVLLNSSLERQKWLNAALYLVLALFFCYLLAEKIIK